VRRNDFDALGDFEARRAGGHDEGADAAGARLLAGAREYAAQASAATSLPASGSDSAKAAIAAPLATFGSHSAFSMSLPASVMAPEPSPCIAKAKSASPS
jgi:hypothetical protein